MLPRLMSTVLTNKNVTAGNIACRILIEKGVGEVIGVFSKALYCKVGKEVVLFHDAKWGVVPFGIAVADITDFLATVDAKVGSSAELSEDKIKIGEREFEISLMRASEEAFVTDKKPSKERIDALYAYVAAHGSSGGMFELVKENRRHVQEHLSALTSGDASATIKLLGLGRGLTPSGDDFLCGFISTLDAAGHKFASSVRDCVSAELNLTTDISAAYIDGVIRREIYTIYNRAAKAVLSSEPFESHTDFVLEMGASSGTDTMLGAIAAAKIISHT